MMSPANGPYNPYTPNTPSSSTSPNPPNVPNVPNTPHNPYAAYPAYPGYNSPWKSSEQAAANVEPAPTARAVRGFWSGRFGVILGTVMVVVTVAAIGLAALAPAQAMPPGATPPAGFTQVYDNGLSNDGSWGDAAGCSFTSQGLDVDGGSGGAVCVFQPSANSDLTSQGFWLQVTVAPAAMIQGSEVPLILIGQNEAILFDEQGAYVVYCANTSSPCAQGTATAWHTSQFVANAITISYDAGSTTLAIFANGQEVTSIPLAQGGQPALALGAGGDGEAIFTHVIFYSANPNARGLRRSGGASPGR